MPRYNVELDGQWACYSTISDYFITPFMDLEDFEKWRAEEYGENRNPFKYTNTMNFVEALRHLCINHTDEEICQNLREIGFIPTDEEDYEEFDMGDPNRDGDWMPFMGYVLDEEPVEY